MSFPRPKTELQRLQEEVARLTREAKEKEAIRNAKVALLRQKVQAVPTNFAAKHPILTFLAGQGASGAKTAAIETGKGLKETGKVALQGLKAFGKYAIERKAAQYRREGNFVEAERLEARARRIRV